MVINKLESEFMDTIDINKHQDFADTGSNAINVTDLVESLGKRLNQRSENDFKKELEDLLKIIEDAFKPKMYAKEVVNGISVEWQCYGEELHNNISFVKDIVNKYLEGKIGLCYNLIDEWWKGKDEKLGTISRLLETDSVKRGTTYFRMRTKDDTQFKIEDMFHVPFEKRGKVGNERYSVSGFPCLYMGSSFYVCWEEMGRPDLKDIVVSSLRCTTSDIRLLDLRFPPKIENKVQLENFLVLLPIIVACSIMVRKSDKDSKFKAEYILPQLILHSIIQATGNDYRYDGIIYTTTKSNRFFEDPSLLENVVIPVKKTDTKGQCPTLSKWFMITPPLYLEREMMKNPTDFTLTYTERYEYEASIFGMAEAVIKKITPQRVEVPSTK